ncbi:MAG: alpha/beta fold hydrolase [Chloroflexota bacterium]
MRGPDQADRGSGQPDDDGVNAGSTIALGDTYSAEGPEDAPPIVFVHGTRLSRAYWRPQLDRLRDEFRVIALDLPGHGALAAEDFTLESAADHVAAVIDDAAGGRAVVVGLSLGGYVSMALAARSSRRLAGLVVSGATAEPTGFRAFPYLGLAWLLESLDGRGLEGVSPRFFRLRYPSEIAEPVIAGGFWVRGGAQALRALRGESFIPRLAAYDGPVLVLNGQFDVVFRAWESAFVGAARQPSRVVIRRASHLANLDRPAAFSGAVRVFARKVYGLWDGSSQPG